MCLGDPQGALGTVELLLAKKGDAATQALRDGLRRGIETLGRLGAELKTTPSPVLLQAVADTHLGELGNPRTALAHLILLARAYPQGAHLRAAAESVFACAERLGGPAMSHRVLQWAARQVGEDALSVGQRLLLAEAASANGEPRTALRWLDRLPAEGVADGLRERAAQAWLGAADQLAAEPNGEDRDALAAYRRVLATSVGTARARAAVGAAKLLTRGGEHAAAARLLLDALAPQGTPAVRREALRLLAAGRVQRRDPLAYDVAEVGELVEFGFLEAAVARAQQLDGSLPASHPLRAQLRPHVARAFAGLAAYHVARGDVASAREAVQRWLRGASRDDDLPAALAQLAACHRMAGDERGLVEVLSRLAAEFPHRSEGAEARRQLMLLDTSRR